MALVLNPAEYRTKYLAISYKIKVKLTKCYPCFIVHTFLKWELIRKVYLQIWHRSIKLTFDTKGFPLSLLFFTQLNNWWHVQSTVKRLPGRFSRWSFKTLSHVLNTNGFLPGKSLVNCCWVWIWAFDSKYSSMIFILSSAVYCAAKNMKFSVKDFFSKCNQICRKQRIWSHLLKKSLMQNFIIFVHCFFWSIRVKIQCFVADIPENEKEVFIILEIVRIQKVVGNISLAHPLYLF